MVLISRWTGYVVRHCPPSCHPGSFWRTETRR
jgi:hypothetical protein